MVELSLGFSIGFSKLKATSRQKTSSPRRRRIERYHQTSRGTYTINLIMSTQMMMIAIMLSFSLSLVGDECEE